MAKIETQHYAAVICPECEATLTATIKVQTLASPELHEAQPGEALPEIDLVLDARVTSLDGCMHAETFDPAAF